MLYLYHSKIVYFVREMSFLLKNALSIMYMYYLIDDTDYDIYR